MDIVFGIALFIGSVVLILGGIFVLVDAGTKTENFGGAPRLMLIYGGATILICVLGFGLLSIVGKDVIVTYSDSEKVVGDADTSIRINIGGKSQATPNSIPTKEETECVKEVERISMCTVTVYVENPLAVIDDTYYLHFKNRCDSLSNTQTNKIKAIVDEFK